MASPASAKKQIIESIKDSTNILVTVSNNPSVDELSAALGLTIFLNKLGKHATAVASGEIPHALEFLHPDKTFEDSADSLRDFIIALDKEKADHLRYKLEGDVVKIFITPYRATITSDDLEFSQGDYNVELVLALNVANRDELDTALSAHGKILHDATVATLTTGDVKSDLGTVSWREASASGVSELVAELIDGLKTPKATPDEQIATAVLTGIVAATERFSNSLTSSRVMTLAAELIAAGANQQLIVTKLEEAKEEDAPGEPPVNDTSGSDDDDNQNPDGSTIMEEGASTKLSEKKSRKKSTKPAKEEKDDEPSDGSIGVMKISHVPEGDIDEVARQVSEESREDAARAAQSQLNRQLEDQAETAEVTPKEEPASPVPDPLQSMPAALADITEDLKQATEEVLSTAPAEQNEHELHPGPAKLSGSAPSIGGTLNATAEQAADDKRREEERDRNQTILTRNKPMHDQAPAFASSPLNAAAGESDEPAPVDIFAQAPSPAPDPQSSTPAGDDALVSALSDASSLADSTDTALNDVHNAFAAAPVDGGLPTVPVAPSPTDVSAVPTLADIEAQSAAPPPPPVPGLPPMPDFSTLPDLPPPPPTPSGIDAGGLPPLPTSPQAEVPPQEGFNPSQFNIPGQQ